MRTGRALSLPISALVALATGLTAPGPLLGRSNCHEPFEGVRAPDTAYLLATPRGDTVPDPVGAAAFGQLADVLRIGGVGTEAVATEDVVVIVPWGFDEDCRPIAWTGSWLWASVGTRGFYRGRLRPRSAWIDDHPTFDVHAAVWEGFPASPWEHPMSTGRPHLSAEQLYDLYDRLPTAAAIAARPYGAVSDLVEWRRAADELAEAYPARMMLLSAFRMAETARVRSTRLPFGGTYRIRVEGESDTLATFLLRTGHVGTEPLESADAEAGPVPTAPRPADTYAAAVALGDIPPDLTIREDAGTPSPCMRALGLRAEAAEFTPEDASRGWRAELAPSFVAACFADVETLRSLRLAEPTPEPVDTGTGLAVDSAGTRLPGAFRQEADGRFTFHQAAALADGTPVELVGDRIDMATLPSPTVVPETVP